MSRLPVVSVVDDDESVRVSVAALVRSLGHEAQTFSSAEDFLGSPTVDATDCLVVDVQMPGMSGVDLQKKIVMKGLKLPMIFITAFPEERIRKKVLSAGALGLLSKPYDGDVLVTLIESALSSR